MSEQLELDELLEARPVEAKRASRARKPYKEATQRPKTLNEAIAGETSSLFGGISFDEHPDLNQLYGTMADLNAIKGTNGLKAVSLFSGCAGSGTGFAWAGWEELMAVEFVKAARETIAANYPSVLIEPNDVTRFVIEWIAENESDLKVEFTKVRNLKKFKHESIINWEDTIVNASLAYKQANEDVEHLNGDDDALMKLAVVRTNPKKFAELIAAATEKEDDETHLNTVKLLNRIAKDDNIKALIVKLLDKSRKRAEKRVPVTAKNIDDLLRLRYDVSKRTFEANKSDGKVTLWGDDIRGIDPQAYMDVYGIKRGELDCLEGSPPCKSFSMSGIREGGWGQVLHYSDERNQRTDDLFIEYVRILKAFMPKTFIAENVQGMTVGSAATDVMVPLLKEFDKMGYRVEARVINSKDYGVPQSRPRVFFVGIRKDLVSREDGNWVSYEWPKPSDHAYVLQDALDAAGESPEEELKFANIEFSPKDGKEYEAGRIWKSLDVGAAPQNKAFQLMRCHPNSPVPTITATSAFNPPAAGPTHPHECRKFTVHEYRYLFGFPRDYIFTGDLGQQGERMGRSVTPYVMKQLAENIANVIFACESDGSEY